MTHVRVKGITGVLPVVYRGNNSVGDPCVLVYLGDNRHLWVAISDTKPASPPDHVAVTPTPEWFSDLQYQPK